MRKRNIGILIVLTMLFVCVGDLFILDLYGKHGRVSETKEIETSKDSLERAKFKNGECEYLVNISRKDLDIKLESNESFWVYVGRPSCPDCQVFYSELETILNKHQKNIHFIMIQHVRQVRKKI